MCVRCEWWLDWTSARNWLEYHTREFECGCVCVCVRHRGSLQLYGPLSLCRWLTDKNIYASIVCLCAVLLSARDNCKSSRQQKPHLLKINSDAISLPRYYDYRLFVPYLLLLLSSVLCIWNGFVGSFSFCRPLLGQRLILLFLFSMFAAYVHPCWPSSEQQAISLRSHAHRSTSELMNRSRPRRCHKKQPIDPKNDVELSIKRETIVVAHKRNERKKNAAQQKSRMDRTESMAQKNLIKQNRLVSMGIRMGQVACTANIIYRAQVIAISLWALTNGCRNTSR